MNHALSWPASIALAAVIALAAWRARALSGSGATAATVLGALAVHAGWSWGVLLVAYFIPSSAWSRFRAAEKAVRSAERVEKEGPRDALQVVANGGVFAMAAALDAREHSLVWQAVGTGALAASAADTWATEIGTLARAVPRSILTWRPVAIGTSGGVTTRGLLAGFAGAALVAVVALLVRWPVAIAVAAMAGGVLGCVVDSLLGAALQARRWCPTCEVGTERRVHRCGTVTNVVGGLPGLGNDGVNLLSTVAGALVAAAGVRYF